MSDSSTPRIRALLVDDHPVVRFGVKHILDSEPDIEVVGCARNREEALSQARAWQPTIAVVDLVTVPIEGMARPASGTIVSLPRSGRQSLNAVYLR